MKPIRLLLPILFACAAAIAAEKKAGPTFTVVPNIFPAKIDEKPLGPCHGGVALDKAGNIYVSTDTERGILVFAPDGKFVRNFGPTQVHQFQLREEKDGEYIYAARPGAGECLKLKLDGTTVWTLKYPAESNRCKDAGCFHPCAVVAVPDGSVFIADGYGSNFIYKFDKDQKYVKSFGGPGPEEGHFQTCHGITVDLRGSKPLLLVCNREAGRMEHWDLDGNFLAVIARDLRMPASVYIRGDNVAIAELKGRVTVLGKDNSILAQPGDQPNEGFRANFGLAPDQWKEGICNSPHGVGIDAKGNVIVSEWSQFGRVEKFKRE